MYRPRWTREKGRRPQQDPTTSSTNETRSSTPAEVNFLDSWQLEPGHSLVIRTSRRDNEGRVTSEYNYHANPFYWPTEPGSVVEAEDFTTKPSCGHGLHGLEWGFGAESYLSRNERSVFQVLDVAEEDIVRIGDSSPFRKSNPVKVKFRKGVLLHSGDYRGAIQLIADHTPRDPAVEERIRSLSNYTHQMLTLGPLGRTEAQNGYKDVSEYTVETENMSGADLISSAIVEVEHLGEHTVMLDIDLPCQLLPSATPGHFHLYIDRAMPWKVYKKFLRNCMEAGIIEVGFYRAAVHRKATQLRVPHRPKQVDL